MAIHFANTDSALKHCGTGLAAARKIQDALQNEHEALFKPTGRNPPINRAITEYRAARDAAGKAMLPSATWEDHDRRLHVAEAQRNALNAQLAEAQAEGSLRSDIDASVVSRLAFGMINSIVEWYRPGGRENADRLADDVVAIALDGLRVPSGSRVEELLG